MWIFLPTDLSIILGDIVNLRYSDSGYSDYLGYSDSFVHIKLVSLV